MSLAHCRKDGGRSRDKIVAVPTVAVLFDGWMTGDILRSGLLVTTVKLGISNIND